MLRKYQVIRWLGIMALPLCVFGTDGMNLEGWGPVSTSLGGASMAFDNGLAAVMNNPATLVYMKDGKAQFEFAIRRLGPDVETSVYTPQGELIATSMSDAFYMPSLAWAKRRGNLVYGVGMYAQGGMGCEYPADSWLGMDYGLTQRSEVSVGRVIAPIAYRLNERMSIAGSFDLVWAGLDLQMALNQAQFVDMANPMAQNIGAVSGTMIQALGSMFEPFGGQGIQSMNYAYFDFSNDSDFTGASRGYGIAGKFGFLYRASDRFSIGGTIHSKTYLQDLEARHASMTMSVRMDTGLAQGQMPSGTYADVTVPLTGKVAVRDFQWPWTFGLGMSYAISDQTMLVGDFKFYQWSDVMDDFVMSFDVGQASHNGNFAGLNMEATLFQNWDDQAVYALGVSHQMRHLSVRGGVNLTDNPIPDAYLNALFPAIVEDHITAGLSYPVGPGAAHLALVYSLQNEATNPGNGTTIPAVTSTHEQLNWSLQYSLDF
ncbi:MAG: outer membrane protein transport protein [Acidobacteria bacterium]|nr:outer membrane protein transport protein [Acidobacteriota bacterium]